MTAEPLRRRLDQRGATLPGARLRPADISIAPPLLSCSTRAKVPGCAFPLWQSGISL
jgi:hypothetical protein